MEVWYLYRKLALRLELWFLWVGRGIVISIVRCVLVSFCNSIFFRFLIRDGGVFVVFVFGFFGLFRDNGIIIGLF